MTDTPKRKRIYVLTHDGSWQASSFLADPALDDAANMELANKLLPGQVLKIATRKPRKPSTPASRAEARAKPGRLTKVATKIGRAAMPELRRREAEASTDANPIFTNEDDIKDKWSEKRIFQLYRQHHKLTAAEERGKVEVAALLEALGVFSNTLQDATGSQFASIMGEGTLNIDMGVVKVIVDGHEVCAFNIMACGPDTYDVRLMALRKPGTVPDHRFIAGLYLIRTLENLKADQIIPELEKTLGTSLRKPMTPVEKLKGLLDKAERDFNHCECDDCKEARARAKLNGTSVAVERAKVDKGLEAIRQAIEALSDTKAMDKIAEATKRSTLIHASLQKATVN
jgi:hypothetical protein